MDSASAEVVDLDKLSVTELKALLREQHAEILSHKAHIESLKLQILKLRRLQFGNRSEKREREIEQLELWVEELETADAQRSSILAERTGATPAPRVAKSRREFSEHLARETQVFSPQESACPQCPGELKYLGEDVCPPCQHRARPSRRA